MKRRIVPGLLILIFLVIAWFAWLIVGPATAFSKPTHFLYVRTGMTFDQLMAEMRRDTVLAHPAFFSWASERIDYPENIKAGKYQIDRGMNLISILRMLKNGRQVPVNLVITKLRTKEDLAALVGRKLECDSAAFLQFLNNEDSLRTYHLDSNIVMTAIYPNTYTFFWNTNPSRVFKKLYAGYKAFWTPERLQEAKAKNLTPVTAYITASIVEEETNRREDKGNIASVYLNRISRGMRLDADPTVKFALRNFELKRIYEKYLLIESPYNTYRYPGLPPGPICTPAPETIDAVLTAPATDYLYFVAKPDFSGLSNFTANYSEHLKNAKAYQQALDEQIRIGEAARNSAGK